MRDGCLTRRFWFLALALPGAMGGCYTSGQAYTPGPASSAPSTPSTAAAPDPYHPAPRDTVDAAAYRGWQQYSLHCARCHGEDAQGSSFGPSLIEALGPDGQISTREQFVNVLTNGRSDKGMPSASKMGLDAVYFDGLYEYLKGRSDGRLHGGRPARRES